MEDRLAAFFKLVVDDPTLKVELKKTGNRDEFVQRAAALAKDRGYNLGVEEIAEALDLVKALKGRIEDAKAA
jgi:hypothetical protein